TVRALELIEVCLCQRETGRPNKFLLVLRVERIEMNRLCRIEFVLGNKPARQQFVDIQTASDLGTDDDTVVPVGRPSAAHHQTVRVDGAAIEERDLFGM